MNAEHIALLLLGSMTATTARAATATTLRYAGLTYDGVARSSETDEQPTTLLRHLTGLIGNALRGGDTQGLKVDQFGQPIAGGQQRNDKGEAKAARELGRRPFYELCLDLTVPAATTKMVFRVKGENVAVNSSFVIPGETVDAWSKEKCRRESRLPAEAFYGLVQDLRDADTSASPRCAPYAATNTGGKHVGR
jgi:hypothetical protein